MDYRALISVPLAALALGASSAEPLRQPDGWMTSSTFDWRSGAPSHEAGVAPETEQSGQRALTVKSLGPHQPTNIGVISQFAMGYSGRRVRLTAQVKTAGVNGWGGLVIGAGFNALAFVAGDPNYDSAPPLGAAGCPDWCEVSVVADVPANGDSTGTVTAGLALVGSGQVWARKLRLEAVGKEVPLSTERFAAQAVALKRAEKDKQRQASNQQPTPPVNLSLR